MFYVTFKEQYLSPKVDSLGFVLVFLFVHWFLEDFLPLDYLQ